jgi:hypothetical protein
VTAITPTQVRNLTMTSISLSMIFFCDALFQYLTFYA